ncbi:hypothetical protein BE20_11120 [Sorangium cellulosum]|nr:hypothetical protein BE20_11120 [Sorangium cellulosum]
MERNRSVVTRPPRGGWAPRHVVAIVFATALIAATGACLQGAVACGDSFCPIDRECVMPADGNPRCAVPGYGHSCGNEILEDGEVCDDGNTNDGDGCSADCKSNERCGNGVVDAVRGEVCDDGNERGGDGCSADCRSNERCGNGIVD